MVSIGQIAGGVIGATIGFVATGFNPQGAFVGFSIGFTIGGIIDPPDGPTIERPRLEDRKIQVSSYGVAIPKVWGRFRLAGNVFWATDLVEVRKKEEVGGGSTGGGTTVVSYEYFANFSIVLCEGPAIPIRIWANKKLIWSRDEQTGVINSKYDQELLEEQGTFGLFLLGNGDEPVIVQSGIVAFQPGLETDLPFPMHEEFDGVGNVPGYRGYAKLHFNRLPVKDFGNGLPTIEVELRRVGFSDYINGIPWDNDASPEDADEFNATWCPLRKILHHWSNDSSNDDAELVTLDLMDEQEDYRITVTMTSIDPGLTNNFEEPVLPVCISGTDWVVSQVFSFDTTNSSGFYYIATNYKTGAVGGPRLPVINLGLQRLVGEATIGILDQDDSPTTPFPPVFFHSSEPSFAFRLGRHSFSQCIVGKLTSDGFGYNIPNAAIWLATIFEHTGAIQWLYFGNVGEAKSSDGFGETFPDFIVKGRHSDEDELSVGWGSFFYATGRFTDGAVDSIQYEQTLHIYEVQVQDVGFRAETEEVAVVTLTEMPFGSQHSGITGALYLGNPLVPDLLPPPIGEMLVSYETSATTRRIDKIDLATGQVIGTLNNYMFHGDNFWFSGGNGEPFFDQFHATNVVAVHPDVSVIGSSGALEIWLLDTDTMLPTLWADDTLLDGDASIVGPDLLRDAIIDLSVPMIITGRATDPVSPPGGSWYYTKIIPGSSPTAEVTLEEIVRDITESSDLVNITESDQTALATQLVKGYMIGKQMTGRQAVEPLQAAFFFNGVEIDGTIIWDFMDKASSRTIEEADLGTFEITDTSGIKLTDIRQLERELPRRLTVRYPDPARDYQPNSQHHTRHSLAVNTRHEIVIDAPIVLGADEAKQIAIRSLLMMWQQRTRFVLTLPAKYATIVPGDIITVPYEGQFFELMVTDINFGANRILELKGVSNDSVIFAVNNLLGTAAAADPQIILGVSDMVPYLINGPLTDDAFDQQNGFGFAVEQLDEDKGFPGAALYRTGDGLTWAELVTVGDPSAIGAAQTALGDHTHILLDRTNTLRVNVGTLTTLASTSFLGLMNGANQFLLGNNGNWEYMAFQKATLVSPGIYDLSILMRGIQGTEWMSDQHAVGDVFILFDASTVRGVQVASGEIGVLRTYKVPAIGQGLDLASPFQFTPDNRHMKPLAPAHVRSARDVSENLTITWVPRVRVDPEIKDDVDTTLDEPVEQYRVEIMDGATVVREFIIDDATTQAYSAAEQTTDFGSAQNPVTVRVAQWSTRVGWGYVREIAI